MIRATSLLTPFIFVLACSGAGEAGHTAPADEAAAATSAELAASEYVDARSYFTEPEEIDAWFALTFALEAEFDAICGDTFCEGDFSNYESLGFRCSVERTRGTIGRCVWIFAASTDEIVPASGQVRVDARSWRCKAPLAPSTPVRDFVRALSGADGSPLHAALPGRATSLYAGLGECFQ